MATANPPKFGCVLSLNDEATIGTVLIKFERILQHGWEGWPSLDDVGEQWRHLQKVTDPAVVRQGHRIAFQVSPLRAISPHCDSNSGSHSFLALLLQILELSVETFTPEFVLYFGEVTHVPPPVTKADPNLLPTMNGQDQSMKSDWSVTVALHPSAIREGDEEGDEREYSWNDLADVRSLA